MDLGNIRYVMRTIWFTTKRWRKALRNLSILTFLVWYITCLPKKLFQDSHSTVLFDYKQQLLGAKIADDGQWRFPACESVPQKFETCILAFEDRNFYSHIGISAKGIGRAIVENWKAKRVVSGGSTLTMQLSRIMRKNPPRTFGEKILEMILATRIELRCSKKEILCLYASHAPFGNNVVGLETAAWRFYGRSADMLSWAESATLAVLPNAPGLIYPGKNQNRLLEKRDRLLLFLFKQGSINKTTYDLALSEPLPQKPVRLPQIASHLMNQFIKEGKKGKLIRSTIQSNLQEKITNQLQRHAEALADNKIFNGAVLVTSVKTGEVLAYVGNTNWAADEYCSQVNCMVAPRSTGSIIKPLLYGKALENGVITPEQLVQDIPSYFGSYSPKNYSGRFEGTLPMNQALSQSLNIPMVHLLNSYGLTKFYTDLKKMGLTTLHRPAQHYGLSLILGGAEVKLFDLGQVYTRLAQELRYGKSKKLQLIQANEKLELATKIMDRGSIFSTFEAMVEVNRPDEENNWKVFNSSQKIAWKTGTSFGFRDAWAVGITPDYVVSIWIGNADGEGRPGLTGTRAAAPLLFDVFALLPQSDKWFKRPENEMAYLKICGQSGHRAAEECPNPVWKHLPKASKNTLACDYHIKVHVHKNTGLRVDSDCERMENIKQVTWFVLPTVVEQYYKVNHPNYVSLPEYQANCRNGINETTMAFIYPKPGSKIYIPKEIDGQRGKSIFEASHRRQSATLFWHLDDDFLGETRDIHQLSLEPKAGKHTLTIVDEIGAQITLSFEVLGKRK